MLEEVATPPRYITKDGFQIWKVQWHLYIVGVNITQRGSFKKLTKPQVIKQQLSSDAPK